MGLISQIVVKKIQQYEENSLKDKYDFWDMYQSFNLSMASLRLKPNKRSIKLRNDLYKNILLNKNAERSFVFFSNLFPYDRRIINLYLKKVEQEEMEEEIYAKVYKRGVVGVLDFELE
ncbi:MAG: hypothetical protein A3K77_04160 [Euryarchaeota archaeon RBG_13_31_8]|nr:MAG: hypothetical protein A3K77_04160 [Euryarchaeota archaeon RBG_13_31_8]